MQEADRRPEPEKLRTLTTELELDAETRTAHLSRGPPLHLCCSHGDLRIPSLSSTWLHSLIRHIRFSKSQSYTLLIPPIMSSGPSSNLCSIAAGRLTPMARAGYIIRQASSRHMQHTLYASKACLRVRDVFGLPCTICSITTL